MHVIVIVTLHQLVMSVTGDLSWRSRICSSWKCSWRKHPTRNYSQLFEGLCLCWRFSATCLIVQHTGLDYPMCTVCMCTWGRTEEAKFEGLTTSADTINCHWCI